MALLAFLRAPARCRPLNSLVFNDSWIQTKGNEVLQRHYLCYRFLLVCFVLKGALRVLHEVMTFTYRLPSLARQYVRWPFRQRDRAWYKRVACLSVRSSEMWIRLSCVRWRIISAASMMYIWPQWDGVSLGTLSDFPTLRNQSMSAGIKVTPRVLACSRTNSFGSSSECSGIEKYISKLFLLEYCSCSSNSRMTRSF